MHAVLEAVAERLMVGDESLIRIPEICEATGVNYGSVYHHFGSREGVIDAAYAMIFNALARGDVELLREVSGASTSFDQYSMSLGAVVGTFSAGSERRARRSLRLRIVSAALTRPELQDAIGTQQAELTDEIEELVRSGQERGWLRTDMTSRAIAVILQSLLVGRTADDISAKSIDDDEWSSAMGVLLQSLLVSA